MLKNNRSRNRRRTENQDYWQSYSDMMAALLLMFILIMAATMYQSLHTYEQKNEDLAKQQEIIDGQKTKLEAQEKALSETTEKLDELNKLVGVKADIIKALSEEFENSDLTVQVDENTGSITFDSSILFASNKDTLSKEGETFLQEFIPRYIEVLLSPAFKEYISEIIIEGHTDTEGGYIYNLDLSQRRAYRVSKYCLDEKSSVLSMDDIETLRKLVTANGRSYSDPVYAENGTVNMDASRRVVFKFRLKDEEMIAEMQKILEGVDD